MQTQQSPTQPEEIVTVPECARRWHCGVSTVYALVKTGKIPAIGLGKKGVRIPYAAALEAVKRTS